MPFLIANAFTLAVALLFIVLGVSHIKWQEENLDQSLPSNYQNNPLPRFKIWLVVNFVGQFMVLIQATIYEINHCKFSSVISSLCRMKQLIRLWSLFSYSFPIIQGWFQLSSFLCMQLQILLRMIWRGNPHKHLQMGRLRYKSSLPIINLIKFEPKWFRCDL